MPQTAMRLWLFALGYFAAYVPYAALTKAMSSGAFSGPVVSGLALLPLSLIASVLSMLAVFSFGGYWRFATTRRLLGRDVPTPSRTTLLAGTATAAVIVTTTLSYAFVGVNISLMGLLMRGGVLLLAPLVDAITGRKVWWYSWVALGLGLIAVLGLSGQAKANLPWLAALDIALYLGAYLIRLLIMSRVGKQVSQRERMRYFVEEQLVASPMALLLVAALATLPALGLDAAALTHVRDGFTQLWSHPQAWLILLIGVLSQATGFFGGLVLLAPQEHSYSVPLNRSGSILAGIVATSLLAAFGISGAPSASEWLAASLLIVSVIVLWRGPKWSAR